MLSEKPDLPGNLLSRGEAERLDRQVRIPGWNQEALARARVGVAGDDPWLTGMYVVAAAALGLNRLTVVAPGLDPRLVQAARGLNQELDLALFPGYFSHFALEEIFSPCQVLVDLTRFALANKLLFSLAQARRLPLVRGFLREENGGWGTRLFTYLPGREWREILEVISPRQLPAPPPGDPVLALVLAGLALEETKKLLLGEALTPEVVCYPRESRQMAALPGPASAKDRKSPPQGPAAGPPRPALAVVGAGALGNFVGLGLAVGGFHCLTFLDPDPVEVTNLNRQILFWDAVGQPKAEALARRLKDWFGVESRSEIAYVTRDTDLSAFGAVFDCTDNFESRIVLSEKCREGGQWLISGGTGVTAGQVVVYRPDQEGPTPAELLGLYDLVGQREEARGQRERAACVYVPEPAIIMTNQIIGGLMVDAYRRLLAEGAAPNLFYDAQSDKMLGE